MALGVLRHGGQGCDGECSGTNEKRVAPRQRTPFFVATKGWGEECFNRIGHLFVANTPIRLAAPAKLPARGDQQNNHARFCILAAFSASHHQMAGNAESPYFGIVSGRLKRSQRALRTLP